MEAWPLLGVCRANSLDEASIGNSRTSVGSMLSRSRCLEEIPAVIEAAAAAGAEAAGWVVLRLPLAVAPLFEQWLEEHFPDRRDKVLNRVRSMRGGSLYESRFGERMRGRGQFADQTAALFELACRRHGVRTGRRGRRELNVDAFRRPGEQLTLLGG